MKQYDALVKKMLAYGKELGDLSNHQNSKYQGEIYTS